MSRIALGYGTMLFEPIVVDRAIEPAVPIQRPAAGAGQAIVTRYW